MIRLDPIEISSGVILGKRRTPGPGPVLATGSPGVRQTLTDLLVPRLETAPCFVGFSGGRDSAALLSLATRLARERSLPDPIPVTLRFEHRPRTDESHWQELTIEHLGLNRWEIVPLGDEVDPLGGIAIGVLGRHGLFWPPVAHRISPLLEVARGHVLMLGTGGDELFSPWKPHPVRRRLGVRGRPPLRAFRRAAFNLLPRQLRTRVRLRRSKDWPWLRPAARREVERRYRDFLGKRSPTWAAAIERLPESRNFELTQAIFGSMARDAGVVLAQPFFEPRFIGAIGASAPRRGFESRAAAMALHFGDVLPPKMLERETKAVFDELHGGRSSRAFAKTWDGSGLDPAMVDVELLREEWLSPRPAYWSLTALNAAWLASIRE